MAMYNPKDNSQERKDFSVTVLDELSTYAAISGYNTPQPEAVLLGARAAWYVFHAQYDVTKREQVSD